MKPWKNNVVTFNNKKPFPNQLQMCVIGSTGCGKTLLVLKWILDGLLIILV